MAAMTGLGRRLGTGNHGEQMGLGQGLVVPKFGDVGTAQKAFASAGEYDGAHGGVSLRLLQAIDQARARVARPRPLTGGLFKVMHGHITVDLRIQQSYRRSL